MRRRASRKARTSPKYGTRIPAPALFQERAEPYAATILRCPLYEVDFTALTETQVHPIYGAWLTLPEVARNETEQTLQFDMMVMLSTHGAGTTTSAPIFKHLPQRAAQAARALLSGTDLTV
jgi:hypothetical protein